MLFETRIIVLITIIIGFIQGMQNDNNFIMW
jgi:hypothetical protein